MNKWNYIGQGSAFDGDMDFAEKIVNYVEVGKVDDIDAVYFYYRSSISSYWVKLEEIFTTNATSEKILLPSFPITRHPIRIMRTLIKIKRYLPTY